MVQLLTLFKICNMVSEATVAHRLALVLILEPINGGRFHIPSGHIQVSKGINGRDMGIFRIAAVIGLVQVIPSGEKQLIVNHMIAHLRSFKEIY